MTLDPKGLGSIPRETLRVARAALRSDNLCVLLRDKLGTVFQDEDFTDLYSEVGRGAESPTKMALISILQYIEELTDRAAAEAVRSRIDWKYLLGLELENSGIDFQQLSEFRKRLLREGAEKRFFDKLLELCRQRGWIKPRGKQRTDSTHVLGAIRSLNRLENVAETLRTALEALAVAAPEWLQSHVRPEWFERYGRKMEDYRLPQKAAEREKFALQVGHDGHELLQAVWAELEPQQQWLRLIPAVEHLRQVWLQQYVYAAGKLQWRASQDQPPCSELYVSPQDRDARTATKRSTSWNGYVAHLTETADEGLPHLIVNVQSTEASRADSAELGAIEQKLAEREVLPAQHLVDASYVSVEQLLQSQQLHHIELIGPARPDTSRQARTQGHFDSSAFFIDWEEHKVTCPEGKTSSSWSERRDARSSKPHIAVSFSRLDCTPCAQRARCTSAKSHSRGLQLLPRVEFERLQLQRRLQNTEEFLSVYRLRAGIEGTLSQAVRCFGLRRARYIGLAKTSLQHLFIALALNFTRIAAFLRGEKPGKTRRSHFLALAPTG